MNTAPATEMALTPGTRSGPYEIMPRSAPREWGSRIAPATRGAGIGSYEFVDTRRS
jgi:hypothetical protein